MYLLSSDIALSIAKKPIGTESLQADKAFQCWRPVLFVYGNKRHVLCGLFVEYLTQLLHQFISRVYSFVRLHLLPGLKSFLSHLVTCVICCKSIAERFPEEEKPKGLHLSDKDTLSGA